MMNDHPHPKLQAYIDGRLPLEEIEAVERHVEQCTACLERLEALGRDAPAWPVNGHIPDLDAGTAHQLQARTFRQLRRSQLSGQTLRLGTQGFLGVVWAILRPFLSFTSSRQERELESGG